MPHIEVAIRQLVADVSVVKDVQPVGGGCISDAFRVSVVKHDNSIGDWFVKTNTVAFDENFRCEFDGLIQLHDAGAIEVPRPLVVGTVGDRAYLISEWVETSSRPQSFFEDFGRALADLHRTTLGNRIGLDRDNYLGSARQINSPLASWEEFVAVHRIGFQLRWAVDQGLADKKLQKDCQRIIDSVAQILFGRTDGTSLLHGDLWSGNYLCGQSDQRSGRSEGQPFIFDPAVYYGCREAEFGMLRLFGSCPESFYDAYNDRFPMAAGWQRRSGIYVLYHLLNHLNLFGLGYHSQCQSIATEILSS